jgi:hypothetical protein
MGSGVYCFLLRIGTSRVQSYLPCMIFCFVVVSNRLFRFGTLPVQDVVVVIFDSRLFLKCDFSGPDFYSHEAIMLLYPSSLLWRPLVRQRMKSSGTCFRSRDYVSTRSSYSACSMNSCYTFGRPLVYETSNGTTVVFASTFNVTYRHLLLVSDASSWVGAVISIASYMVRSMSFVCPVLPMGSHSIIAILILVRRCCC